MAPFPRAPGDYAGSGGLVNWDQGDTAPFPEGAIVRDAAPTVRFASVIDGLSNTLFFGEKHVQIGTTYGDDNGRDYSIYNSDTNQTSMRCGDQQIPSDPKTPSSGNAKFGSRHPGVCQFVLGDGSVRGIQATIPTSVLSAMATIQGGEVVDFSFAP